MKSIRIRSVSSISTVKRDEFTMILDEFTVRMDPFTIKFTLFTPEPETLYQLASSNRTFWSAREMMCFVTAGCVSDDRFDNLCADLEMPRIITISTRGEERVTSEQTKIQIHGF